MNQWFYCRACGTTTASPDSHIADCSRAQRRKEPNKACIPIPSGQCAQCYGGFKGKSYCPVCGNTKEPALDEWGIRIQFGTPELSPSAFTKSLSGYTGLKAGQRYKVRRAGRDDFEVMQCLMTAGPMARMLLNGQRAIDVHISELNQKGAMVEVFDPAQEEVNAYEELLREVAHLVER